MDQHRFCGDGANEARLQLIVKTELSIVLPVQEPDLAQQDHIEDILIHIAQAASDGAI